MKDDSFLISAYIISSDYSFVHPFVRIYIRVGTLAYLSNCLLMRENFFVDIDCQNQIDAFRKRLFQQCIFNCTDRMNEIETLVFISKILNFLIMSH